MGKIVVLGEPVAVQGFALAGATVLEAEQAGTVRQAWKTLPRDTSVVILSAAAAAVLGDVALAQHDKLLIIAMSP